jgi:4-hydroxybenzoate polyprenyltransferase
MRLTCLIWALALADIAHSAIFLIAFGVAAGQAVWHWTLIRRREREGCFRAFRLNHWMGATLFAGIAVSYATAGA